MDTVERREGTHGIGWGVVRDVVKRLKSSFEEEVEISLKRDCFPVRALAKCHALSWFETKARFRIDLSQGILRGSSHFSGENTVKDATVGMSYPPIPHRWQR